MGLVNSDFEWVWNMASGFSDYFKISDNGILDHSIFFKFDESHIFSERFYPFDRIQNIPYTKKPMSRRFLLIH